MPFVNIDLLRGKSREYLHGVSDAVHEALVEGLGMLPEDRLQVINQHEPGELVFNRDLRGGHRTDDFVVFTITDDQDRGEQARRTFYQTLVRNLAKDPGMRPADVFVMIQVTPPVTYSFADGVTGTETASPEALDRTATVPGTRDAYTKTEMVDAITRLFRDNDRSRIVPMLHENFVLTMPTSVSYGGEFTGPRQFDDYFKRVVEGDYYESFVTDLTRVIEADEQLIAQITIAATGKTTGRSMNIDNTWVFDIADGKLERAQIYADTAAVIGVIG